MNRLTLKAFRLLLLVLCMAHQLAFAQSYPVKNVRIVVPFPPGGTSDYLARMIGQRLSPLWSVPIIVENRAGASNIIGSDSVAKANPDGHSILMAFSTHTSNLCIYRKLPYDTLKDFTPVTNVAIAPHVLVVHPSLPVRSVRDLINLAQSRPGELNFASAGSGSSQHLAGALFNSMARVNIVHIPYKGGVPALNDVLGGHSSLMYAPILPALPHIKAGKLLPLAVTSLQRTQVLPLIPTLAESGFAGYDSNSWFGLLTTGGTSRDVVRTLNTTIVQVIKSTQMQEALISQGLLPIGDTPEEFANFIKDEIEKACKLIRELGVKSD